MILYGFHMVFRFFPGFLHDFIWLLYDFTLFYMIIIIIIIILIILEVGPNLSTVPFF